MDATHFKDLNPNQQAIPSLGVAQFWLRVDFQQGFERFEPHREDGSRRFVYSVGELILDHVQSSDTLAEY